MEIRRITEADIDGFYHLDGGFQITSYLEVRYDHGEFSCQEIGIEPFEKKYDDEDDGIDLKEYIKDENKTCFLAFHKGKYAGRLMIHRSWNKYGFVDDLTVDKDFRRLGIAQALMNEAKEWSKGKGLSGLALETQTNNVGACSFYKIYGFEIGGVNKHLYTGLNNEEIALFWYYLFKE